MSINKFAIINLPINAGQTTNSQGHYVPEFEFGIAGRGMYDYQWIFICGCIFAFTMAFGMGANDVANSFATSVGARTLKMWQAIFIAALCEFFGAYLMGARVTATIKGGIVKIDTFEGHDDLLMFGMLCTLICVTGWLMVATFSELTVSSTHSVIGGIIGFGLCSPSGGASVDWEGVGLIIASWFVSPLLSSIIAFLVFNFVRWAILRRGDLAYGRVFMFFPFLVFVTFTVNILFILEKGGIASGQGISQGPPMGRGEVLGITFGVSIGLALITQFILNPHMRRRIDGMSEEKLRERYAQVTAIKLPTGTPLPASDTAAAPAAETAAAAAPPTPRVSDMDKLENGPSDTTMPRDEVVEVVEESALAINGPERTPSSNAAAAAEEDAITERTSMEKIPIDPMVEEEIAKKIESQLWLRIEAKLDWLFSQDLVYAAQAASTQISEMHSTGETFAPKVEIAFGFLQVFTACFASFAHGANDVSNAIGPLAAIVSTYDLGVGGAGSDSPVPDWVLVLGGIGIIFGLAIYGHIIIATVGVKMVKITPSRGFSAELSTSFVIVVGSFLGLPLSSTQVSIGSIIGIGLAEGNAKRALNWKGLGRIFMGWGATLIVAGSTTALIYSFATFAPSQVYPLSKHNCIAFYAEMKNESNGDPSTYTQTVDSQGTLAGIYGFPVNGSISVNL